MSFSLDLQKFYWTDSTARVIYVFDYDRRSGEISNRTEFLQPPQEHGLPDGLTMDTEGCIWQAFWDGSAIRRYSPQAELLETIDIPVPKVTSLIFGGADLRELYVTTAGGSDDADTEDGTLYRVRVGVQGRPEFRSRVCLDH
jgi:D-xylonolactonase